MYALLFLPSVGMFIWWLTLRQRGKIKFDPTAPCRAVLSRRNGFSPAVATSLWKHRQMIAIDPASREIAIVRPDGTGRVIPYDQLVDAEALFDGRPAPGSGNAVAGALVGGALAGSAGTVMGAMIGNGVKFRRLSLRLTTTDIQRPTVEALFLDVELPVSSDNVRAREPLRALDEWSARMKVILADRPQRVIAVGGN